MPMAAFPGCRPTTFLTHYQEIRVNTSSVGAIAGANYNNRLGADVGLQASAPEIATRMVELNQEIQVVTDRVHNLIDRVTVVSRMPSPETAEKESQPNTNSELGSKILEQQLMLRALRRIVDDALARLEI